MARRSASAQAIELSPEGANALAAEALTDLSPLALRMSSPFNVGYWLA